MEWPSGVRLSRRDIINEDEYSEWTFSDGRSSLDSALEDSVSQEKSSDKKLNIEPSYPPF